MSLPDIIEEALHLKPQERYIIIENLVQNSIFYAIDNDTIIILSVAHQRRKPYYWVDDGRI